MCSPHVSCIVPYASHVAKRTDDDDDDDCVYRLGSFSFHVNRASLKPNSRLCFLLSLKAQAAQAKDNSGTPVCMAAPMQGQAGVSPRSLAFKIRLDMNL